MKTIELDSQNFDSSLANTDLPVLVDFYGEGCGPCRMMAPVIDQIAADRAERAVVTKLDAGAAYEIASRFGVTAVPTFMVFKKGQVVATARGAQSKTAIEALLDRAA